MMELPDGFVAHNGTPNPFPDDRLKRVRLAILTNDGVVVHDDLARTHVWEWSKGDAPLGAVLGWMEILDES